MLASDSAVTAETARGTSDSAWLRRVAVTTMSPVSTCAVVAVPVVETAEPSAVEPPAGLAALASVSVVCAETGAASANSPAESSHMDLRIDHLP